jgi:acid stress-induced BolA-like protein IbaG/YrbA
VPLQILNAGPDPEKIAAEMRGCIERALPGAQVEVRAVSPGHFEIRVVSERFAGQSSVRKQQAVYRAIAHLMSGKEAPVHAVDRMLCEEPP